MVGRPVITVWAIRRANWREKRQQCVRHQHGTAR
jgi:hypothetical protein